ncbi:MAG: hypothetical protein KAW09_05040 [Thermoplasmata archaeon]|nr:hypothetical protein [Thermoplasmata archaeon]
MQHRVKTNVHRAMVSYKDQYDSHATGLIQEVIQNAADAKIEDLSWKDWRFVGRYDSDAHTLSLRDYGTTGMPHCRSCNWGELDGTEVCSDKSCNWGVFHSFAFLAKEGGMLGSRGQGKSLAIVAGGETIVRTKVATDMTKRMASRWTFDGEDWLWELALEELPDDQWPPGTEIEIRDVKDDIHAQLMDRDAILSDIQNRWFPIIQQGARIRFGFSRESHLKQVPGLRYPKQAKNPVTGKRVGRSRERLEIKHGGGVMGELRSLSIAMANQPMVEGDPRIGVALIKNGMQVITRLNKFPRRIPPDIQARIYGEVQIRCTEDNTFLEPAENPDHRGYKSWDPLFQKVRSAIEAEVSSLVEPYMVPLEECRIKKKDRDKARRALEVIQRALEDVPELRIFGGREIPPPLEPRVRDHPYISRIELDRKEYARGEQVQTKTIVMNPIKKEEAFYRLDIELRDASLQVLETKTASPVLPAASEESRGRKEIKEFFDLPPSLEPGRQRIIAKLYEAESGQPPTLVHSLGKWLWLEAEPPTITRPRKPKVGTADQAYENTLRELWPVDDEAIPPDTEMIFIESDAAMWFNLRGVRLQPFWGKVRPAGSEFPILYGLVAEELISKLTDHRIAEADVEMWSPEQVRSFGDELVGLSQRFLRACISHHET